MKAALREGAKLAMACGVAEDEPATELFAADCYEQVMNRHEESHPETHLLRVRAAFLQTTDDPAPVARPGAMTVVRDTSLGFPQRRFNARCCLGHRLLRPSRIRVGRVRRAAAHSAGRAGFSG